LHSVDACPSDSVLAWLGSLALGRYVTALEEAGYDDLRILREAEDDEVQEIITMLAMPRGHARQFERGLRKLREKQLLADLDSVGVLPGVSHEQVLLAKLAAAGSVRVRTPRQGADCSRTFADLSVSAADELVQNSLNASVCEAPFIDSTVEREHRATDSFPLPTKAADEFMLTSVDAGSNEEPVPTHAAKDVLHMFDASGGSLHGSLHTGTGAGDGPLTPLLREAPIGAVGEGPVTPLQTDAPVLLCECADLADDWYQDVEDERRLGSLALTPTAEPAWVRSVSGMDDEAPEQRLQRLLQATEQAQSRVAPRRQVPVIPWGIENTMPEIQDPFASLAEASFAV